MLLARYVRQRSKRLFYGVLNSVRRKIEGYIQLAIDEGAKLVIDGWGRSLPGHEEGFFLWPTLIDYATPSMKSYQDEIFGPVLQIVRAETFEEALSYPNVHHQGNAVTVFTRTKVVTQRWPRG